MEEQLYEELLKKLTYKSNNRSWVKLYYHVFSYDLCQLEKIYKLPYSSKKLEELENIGKLFEKICLSKLNDRTTIAIAGGFSAGKSVFISRFLEKFHLPSSITPTTAIPVYIHHHERAETTILGQKKEGDFVNLSVLDSNILHKLSHYTLQDLQVNLKELMPNILLYTRIKSPYTRISFIDTPGYNPANSTNKIAQEDYQTSMNLSRSADSLIWLIGLDVNGTIPSSDIAFLTKIQQYEPNKPIYIVLNKADCKPLNDIDNIIDTILDTLDDHDIRIEGISAYNAIEQKLITYRYRCLDRFMLNMCDKNYNTKKSLRTMLNSMYATNLAIPFGSKITTKTVLEKDFNRIIERFRYYLSKLL